MVSVPLAEGLSDPYRHVSPKTEVAVIDVAFMFESQTGINYTETLFYKGHLYDQNCRAPYCLNCEQSIYNTAFSELTCDEFIIKNIIE